MKQQNALPKPALDQLAREQRAMADVHPDADVLTALCEGVLTGTERSQIMEHIARCGDCRDVVFLAAPDALSQPAAKQKAAPSAAKPLLSWWRRYMPAIAAAAAVVVVGSAVLLQPNLMTSRQAGELQKLASAPPIEPGSPGNAPASQAVESDKQVPGKLAAQNKTSQEVPSSKKAESLPAGAVGGAVADSRKRDEALGSAQLQQQQLTASGPHGPVESKGYSGNYQNMAVTPPPQAARVAPGAHGDLEAKGNAYFMSNAAPQLSKEQLRAGAAPAKVATKDQLEEGSVVALRSASAPPAKSKTDTQISTSAKPSAQSGTYKNEVVAADIYRADASDGIIVGSQEPMPSIQASVSQPYRFRIDDDGELQRSSGRDDWKPALAKAQTRVNAVSVVGSSVWAGGSQGRLFHSKDGGDHWTKIQLEASGKPLSDTITSISFRDLRSGTVTTDSGAVWETYDGGRHWRKKQ